MKRFKGALIIYIFTIPLCLSYQVPIDRNIFIDLSFFIDGAFRSLIVIFSFSYLKNFALNFTFRYPIYRELDVLVCHLSA